MARTPMMFNREPGTRSGWRTVSVSWHKGRMGSGDVGDVARGRGRWCRGRTRADSQATQHNHSSLPGRCPSRSARTVRTPSPQMCRRILQTRQRATGSRRTGQQPRPRVTLSASPLSEWGWASARLWLSLQGCDPYLAGWVGFEMRGRWMATRRVDEEKRHADHIHDDTFLTLGL
jgi:hypothetical protein